MKLYEAIKRISTQVGDEGIDVKAAQAQNAFLESIYSFIDSGEFEKTDIPAYHRLEKLVDFSTQPYNLTSLDLYKILNIYPDPATSKEVRVTLKEVSDLSQIAYSEERQPTNEEVIIYRIGNGLTAIVSSTDPNFSVSADKLYMDFIAEIRDDDWVQLEGSGTDLNDVRGTTLTSGSLVIGELYEIEDFKAGDDFANVGGTNVDNTFFVATVITPTTWTNSSVLRRQKLFSIKFTNRCIAKAVQIIKAADEEQQ